MNQITSPLTGSTLIEIESEIDCSTLIKSYSESYGVDVSMFFKDLTKIQLCRCLETGYRFYFPLNLAGDGDFYERLQRNDWYYMDWKWEHETAYALIEPGSDVLEIGCARGSFLRSLQGKANCTGLELNMAALEETKKKAIPVFAERVEEHAKKHKTCYDIVCAFQVVEHIPNVGEFLASSIDLLRKGGKLIVSVPNNESFIRHNKESALNMPPHHMGLWSRASLASLERFFPLRVVQISNEPLQREHFSFFLSVQLSRIALLGKFGRKALRRLLLPAAPVLLKPLRNMIPGHTIFTVYEKK